MNEHAARKYECSQKWPEMTFSLRTTTFWRQIFETPIGLVGNEKADIAIKDSKKVFDITNENKVSSLSASRIVPVGR